MTREEQIRNAKNAFYERIFEEGYYYDPRDCFEEGAEWADSHPVNMWHDANEPPRLNQWVLAQIGDNAFDTFVMSMSKNEDWKELSNAVNIKRWAYIDNLLPKKS